MAELKSLQDEVRATPGVEGSTARRWCLAGLVEGARKLGRDWLVPEGSLAPLKAQSRRGRRLGKR